MDGQIVIECLFLSSFIFLQNLVFGSELHLVFSPFLGQIFGPLFRFNLMFCVYIGLCSNVQSLVWSLTWSLVQALVFGSQLWYCLWFGLWFSLWFGLWSGLWLGLWIGLQFSLWFSLVQSLVWSLVWYLVRPLVRSLVRSLIRSLVRSSFSQLLQICFSISSGSMYLPLNSKLYQIQKSYNTKVTR